jgi:hypothetical protein
MGNESHIIILIGVYKLIISRIETITDWFDKNIYGSNKMVL